MILKYVLVMWVSGGGLCVLEVGGLCVGACVECMCVCVRVCVCVPGSPLEWDRGANLEPWWNIITQQER